MTKSSIGFNVEIKSKKGFEPMICHTTSAFHLHNFISFVYCVLRILPSLDVINRMFLQPLIIPYRYKINYRCYY